MSSFLRDLELMFKDVVPDPAPHIYLSVYFDNGDDFDPVVELTGWYGLYCYDDLDYGLVYDLPEVLAKELGSGTFECMVQAQIDYYQCNHPLDPEEWDADVHFELLNWRKIDV